jgi:hypothetical protein
MLIIFSSKIPERPLEPPDRLFGVYRWISTWMLSGRSINRPLGSKAVLQAFKSKNIFTLMWIEAQFLGQQKTENYSDCY